jgi:outer membrane protein insertion porin family
MTSKAAQRKVCFRILSRCALCFAALLVLPGSVPAETSRAARSAKADERSFLFSSTLDLVTGETVTKDNSAAAQEPGTAPAQGSPAIIERIEFVGNRRIRSDTLRARIFSRDGDPYNEETLRRDFQALWNTQFFEDVKLRVEDSPDKPGQKIVLFEVKERPVIRRIRYEGIHSISESDILDRFKDRKVGLSVESQFDPTKIKKAEVVLQELLGEHGRQFAKVTPQYERIASSNAVILIFKIVEGPKVKVGRISFTGNRAFSNRKLIRAMRHDRPYAIPLYFLNIGVLSKTYDHDKLNEDLEVGVRGLYQNNGYFKVLVGDPILKNRDTKGYRLGVPLTGRTHGKAVDITIPIEEGERYRMGSLKIVSADPDKALSLKVDALKTLFPLHEGEIFDISKVRKALENYTKAYGEYGFIDFTAEPETDIDDEAKKINLTLKFDEQKQYYVRRIDFSGNTTTRDKVIRRELLLDEGQLFNKRLWELSILRLNQLDYFNKIEADKAAEIKRNPKQGTVDITLKLKEKGKQSIGLNGGISGLAGGFIGLTYQTNNFLGLGETLTFSAQFGDLQRSFLFGFTEPYLFDRPISTGFTVFSSRYTYDQAKQTAILFGQNVSINPQFIQNYNQNSKGFTLYASYPVRKLSFARIGLTYGLTKTDIQSFNQASTLLFELLQFQSFAGPSALNGITSSTLTPTISYNTIDSPINPTTGKSVFYSMGFSGGPIGGNVNTITNIFEYKQWHPINKRRNALGFRVQSAYITGYGGRDIPPYSRFYLGGENDIRGFDIRSVSPVTFLPSASSQQFTYFDFSHLNSSGQPTLVRFSVPVLAYTIAFPGGDMQTVGNFEYHIPIVGNYVGMDLFADAGTDGILNRGGLKLNPTGVTSLLQQFPNAKIPSRLDLAPGTNFHLRVSTGIQFVVQLPIVQAPFRIYWAYNPERLHRQVVAPPDFIEPSELQLLHDRLPPDVFNFQVLPTLQGFINNPGRLNYFEPRSTFRFTVGKTF